jgi:hypothetical protein
MTDDLTTQERDALAATLGDDDSHQEWTYEYAVVAYKRGKPLAEGPYPRHLAEKKAEDKGGVVAKRTKTTFWGRWTALDAPDPDSFSEEGS